MSAPDSASSTWDFFQTGGPYWLGDGPTYLWSPVLGKSWFKWTFENSLSPWTTLSNCPTANNLSAVLKLLSKVSKNLYLVSQFRNTRAGGAGLGISRSQTCTTAEGGTNRPFCSSESLSVPLHCQTGRAKVDLAFGQTQPRPPHLTVAGELLRIHHNFYAFNYCRANNASVRF